METRQFRSNTTLYLCWHRCFTHSFAFCKINLLSQFHRSAETRPCLLWLTKHVNCVKCHFNTNREIFTIHYMKCATFLSILTVSCSKSGFLTAVFNNAVAGWTGLSAHTAFSAGHAALRGSPYVTSWALLFPYIFVMHVRCHILKNYIFLNKIKDNSKND